MAEIENKEFAKQHLFLWVLFALTIFASAAAMTAYFSAVEFELSKSHEHIYWFAGIFSGTVGTLVAAAAAILFAKNLAEISKSNHILAQSEETAREAAGLRRDLFELELLTKKVPKLDSTLSNLWSLPYRYRQNGAQVDAYNPVTGSSDKSALKNSDLISEHLLATIFEGFESNREMDKEVSSRLNQVIKIAYDYFKYLKLGGAPDDVKKTHLALMKVLEPIQKSRGSIENAYPTSSTKAALLKLIDLCDIIQNQMTHINQRILDEIEDTKLTLNR